MAMVTHTQALTLVQVRKLREILEEQGFDFSVKPYTIYAAQKPNLSVAVYEKGPKVLIQGKGTEDFIQFVLEPQVLGEAVLGYEEVHDPDQFRPHIGVDESGKGDVFGPLVIAGVFVNENSSKALRKLGVMDSKKIHSAKKIQDLARKILETPEIDAEIITLNPPTYNDLYEKFRNVNHLLAWGHGKVIQNLFERHSECHFSLSDQFAHENLLKEVLKKRVSILEIRQKTKAESDVAVAAASILARNSFIAWFEGNERIYGQSIPLGAGDKVNVCLREMYEKHGIEMMRDATKMHFKPCQELIQGA